MKIEVLEKILHEREVFEAGETRVVDDALGKYFCANGWAKDADGNVPTGERDVNRRVTLNVDNTRHATAAGEANG